MYSTILQPGTVKAVQNELYWSIIADESTDSATQEHLGLYIRYVDLHHWATKEVFLQLKRILGHPTADQKCYQNFHPNVINNGVIFDKTVIMVEKNTLVYLSVADIFINDGYYPARRQQL